ncbi:hypothetical protein PAXRUDRAFT_167805 [Paxillus rubicundulus Ve08.2h10]|uniref:Uncharacterized protein n=1 Tax=Paxillus rubicundulus Ve08.2h10 TaxID=930991 RepID=A0A0D0CP88_9AGAM|nr:hypothetical protein PAXRUDRAFT_167805 [Paxillus rubicundulus Ve08.2h10]
MDLQAASHVSCSVSPSIGLCNPKTNQTPVFIDQDILQSPSHKCPDYNHNVCALFHLGGGSPRSEASEKMHSGLPTPPTSSPPPVPTSLYEEVLIRRKHSLEVSAHMKTRFLPYRRQIAPPPLELCFAMKSLGRSSYMELGFEDVVEVWRQKFQHGLNQLSDMVVHKAYEAKMATKICILNRLSLMQSEIYAQEKQVDFLCAIQGEVNEELSLSATDEELNCIKGVLADRGITIKDHMAFKHTVYSDDLVALTIADMQLHQISLMLGRRTGNNSDKTLDSELSNKDVTDDQASDSESSDGDVADDLEYED